MVSVVCIGAGRLAHHLMPQLQQTGCQIFQIYNRDPVKAEVLARQLGDIPIVSTFEDIVRDADLYFLTVSDDAVPVVANLLYEGGDLMGIVVHTSGVLGLDVLPFKRRGIFYPLQTFSPEHPVPWRQTPILVTSGEAKVRSILKGLAAEISDKVHSVSDDQKIALHLAAVFANNFTNHILVLAQQLCHEHQLSFDLLAPLIRETMVKALEAGPLQSQTGPAVRGDHRTLEKHLALLDQHPQLAELYRLISASIVKVSGERLRS